MSTSDLIAIVNIIATSLLSVFVYRATKKSADAAEKTVNLTEETFKFSKSIQERQSIETENQRKALRLQYVDVLYKKCEQIRKAVTSSDATHIFRSLRNLDCDHHIKPETLAFCYSDNEVYIINKAWSTLDTYLELYYKETYQGDEMGQLVTNAPGPIEAFEKLKNLLESIRVYY